MNRVWRFVALCGVLLPSALAQTGGAAFPAAVLAAKTVAVVNETRDPGVTRGADAALASWGQFTLVDDPATADITLRFDKTKEHAGTDTQKTDPNTNKTDYGYSMSFSSTIHMKAYAKDGDAPFYSTKTDDSKTKAGMNCVNDFHTAYRTARQQQAAKPQ